MQPIKDLTDELRLNAFYEALSEQLTQSAYDDMSFQERVFSLLQAESLARQNRRIAQLQKEAKLPEKTARFEEIDFLASRGIYKPMLLDLFSNAYLRHYRNIILTGPTGTGKSYIAQALANKAMTHGHSALYLRVPRLMQLLSSARGDDEYIKMLGRIKRIKLLILDDFGVSPLKASEARDLLEIVEDRTNNASLIITSQLPIVEWHAHLHNPTIADAILDRVVHSAYKIELKGESQRKMKAEKEAKNEG